jgi:hypothetical protein
MFRERRMKGTTELKNVNGNDNKASRVLAQHVNLENCHIRARITCITY